MMNIEEIKSILGTTDVSDYEIIDVTKESSELFFVLKKLELNRSVNTETLNIKVYKDVDDQRGSSTVVVTSADNSDTLKNKIDSAIQKAQAALNPYFPLVDKEDTVNHTSNIDASLNDIALEVSEAILKADHYDKGWINSTEIFVSKVNRKFLNSKGLSQEESKFCVEFEIIPTWSGKNEEYELYLYYQNNEVNTEDITKQVEEILTLSKYRSEAVNFNDVSIEKDIPVLMYGEMNDLLVDSVFNDDTSYQSVVTKSSHYSINDVISDNKFDVTLKAEIPGVFNSKQFDNHGVSLNEVKIIEEGKLISNHGDIQYGHYAGVDKPTGSYSVMEINAEGVDVLKQPHLLVDYFSAPQYEMSGYFGGEVRLARYFDGEKYIPVTGLSVSGKIFEALKDIQFSKEITCTPSYKGPKYFIFKGLSIS